MLSSFWTTAVLLLATGIPSAWATIGDACSQKVLGTTTHGTCQKVSKCKTGATVRNLCPHDPDDVRCCFDDYPCQLDTFPGTCQDVKTQSCGGNRYVTKLCPGPDNTQCCLSSDTTVDRFVKFLKDTYDLATQYRSGKANAASANELVMEWLRHEQYNDISWKLLLGGVDNDWISFAQGKKHPMFAVFLDPYFCDQKTETDHLGATMHSVFRFPPLAYPYVNRGDFGGWGGDLVQLYGEWQGANKPDGRAFAKSRILGNESRFKMLDAIEDADGFNLAMALRDNSSATIYDVAAEYYKPAGGYRSRFSSFYKRRFDGGREHSVVLAHEMLAGPIQLDASKQELLTEGLRIAVVQKTSFLAPAPAALSDAELRPLLDGVADALEALAVMKGREC